MFPQNVLPTLIAKCWVLGQVRRHNFSGSISQFWEQFQKSSSCFQRCRSLASLYSLFPSIRLERIMLLGRLSLKCKLSVMLAHPFPKGKFHVRNRLQQALLENWHWTTLQGCSSEFAFSYQVDALQNNSHQTDWAARVVLHGSQGSTSCLTSCLPWRPSHIWDQPSQVFTHRDCCIITHYHNEVDLTIYETSTDIHLVRSRVFCPQLWLPHIISLMSVWRQAGYWQVTCLHATLPSQVIWTNEECLSRLQGKIFRQTCTYRRDNEIQSK